MPVIRASATPTPIVRPARNRCIPLFYRAMGKETVSVVPTHVAATFCVP